MKSRFLSPHHPPTTRALLTLAFLAIITLTTPQNLHAQEPTKPSACAELRNHPHVVYNTQLLRGVAFRTLDTSLSQRMRPSTIPPRSQLRLAQAMIRYTQHTQTLTILSTDIPKGVSLVDFTCALGRNLQRPVHETIIIVSPVGLHAWSGALTYQQLRTLARTHNPTLHKNPTLAAAKLSHGILDIIETHRRMRWGFFAVFIASLACALATLTTLLRSSHKKNSQTTPN